MFSTLLDPGSVYWVSILCLSCSEQGDTHGGQLRPKGGGAWVCGPGWWDAQRPDVTRPLWGPFPLHRRWQEHLLGLGVELRRQEGLGSIEGERWGYSYLFAPYSSPPSFPSPLLPCESGLAIGPRQETLLLFLLILLFYLFHLRLFNAGALKPVQYSPYSYIFILLIHVELSTWRGFWDDKVSIFRLVSFICHSSHSSFRVFLPS